MNIGLEAGISSFYIRRQSFFQGGNIDGSYNERIKDLKQKLSSKSANKPLVVILGAGPAGLLRAIHSISNGNPTKVIERRSENTPGRSNTVALTETTITMLKYCGIYQYLVENKLISNSYKNGYLSVRLVDLELAMKEVLRELCPTNLIEYDSKVTKVDSQAHKISLNIKSSCGNQILNNIDILVNAEGSHSSTNNLLQITRTEVLPRIPVIAAIYKDNRPKITNVNSFFKYVGKSVHYIAKTTHYHVQFIFKLLFLKKFRRQITGSIILNTPKQTYVGGGFSNKINNKLISLKKIVNDKKNALEKNVTNPDNLKLLQKEYSTADKKYNTYAKKWINNSLCMANLIAILKLHPSIQSTAFHKTFDSFQVIKIGADHANEFSRKIGQSSVLLTGDASATVDPTTGLGCNTALQSSIDFLDYIWDHDAGVNQKQLLKNYNKGFQERVTYIHEKSTQMRRLYRPDALIPGYVFRK